MGMERAKGIPLSPPERRELWVRVRARGGRAEDVKRARLVLMLGQGKTYREISEQLGCSLAYVARWKMRFLSERLAGLHSRHAGKAPGQGSLALEARILEWTRKAPSNGATQWSTRSLAEALGVNHMRVARAWARAGLQPHRMRRYMASNDPDFESKAADVIGLYLNPPQHAAVFCVDEKTAIQALDRLDPVLPMSRGRAERQGFEYYRHGTLSLFAALNVKTGQVTGQPAPRHTSAQFVAFLQSLLAELPARQQVHIIADNLSTHRTKLVTEFLKQNSRVTLHFTPTYSSWLNQIENWFSKIERDLIARGVFTSVPDLKRKILRYIRLYNRNAKPLKWRYNDTNHRVKS